MTFFLQATLTIKYGSLPQLVEVMTELVESNRERGLTMRGAYYPVVGDFTKVTHIWEIKDMESLQAALEGIGSDPRTTAVIKRLSAIVEKEVLEVVMKTPYSP